MIRYHDFQESGIFSLILWQDVDPGIMAKMDGSGKKLEVEFIVRLAVYTVWLDHAVH